MTEKSPSVNTSGQLGPEEVPGAGQTLQPAVDIFEVDEGLAVIADLPGVNKEDVAVSVHDGVLTIRGAVKRSAPGEEIYSEFDLLNFFRQFQLNDEVDQDNIKADMKFGVLTVRLPKKDAAKPKRIDIRVS